MMVFALLGQTFQKRTRTDISWRYRGTVELANFVIIKFCWPLTVLIFYGEDVCAACVGPYSLPCLDESSET